MVKFVYFSGICFLLTLIFVGLKNYNIIDWPMWLVFSPIFLFYLLLGLFIIYKGVKK